MLNLQSDIESLLENEALTSDLDDDAANVLLEWGMAHVRLIHRMAPEQPAPEEFVATQMKATRKWMRAVNRWTPARAEKDAAENAAALEEVLTLASVRASAEQQTAFLTEHLADPPTEFITHLSKLAENPMQFSE
jgi:Zn-dependent M32 family carboxypeptidase